jgi:hypothetical protein
MTTELITVLIWYGAILNLPCFGAIDGDGGDDGCHAGFSGVPALLLAGTTASMIVLATAAPHMTALAMGTMIVAAAAAAATTAFWVVAGYVPQLIHSFMNTSLPVHLQGIHTPILRTRAREPYAPCPTRRGSAFSSLTLGDAYALRVQG